VLRAELRDVLDLQQRSAQFFILHGACQFTDKKSRRQLAVCQLAGHTSAPNSKKKGRDDAMATGQGARDAAQEQQRRERMRDEYDSGLDKVPTAKQERQMRERGENPDDNDEDRVRGAGYGAAGILGDLF
jgi:hypothetical protein